MMIKITKEIADGMEERDFAVLRLPPQEKWGWGSTYDVVPERLGDDELALLRGILEKNRKAKGSVTALRQLKAVVAARAAGVDGKAESVRQATVMLIEALRAAPGHRVYVRDGEPDPYHLPYIVTDVKYVETVYHKGGGCTPEHITATLAYSEFGSNHTSTWYFQISDVVGKTVEEMLASEDAVTETAELRAAYEAQTARWSELVAQPGTQLWARGTSFDSVDDATHEKNQWRSRTPYQMIREGSRSIVVSDVFSEREDTSREREKRIDFSFWAAPAETSDEDTSESVPPVDFEVPIHHYLAVFDLARHLRLRIHVDYLETYSYDTTLAEKLVLPATSRALIEVLLQQDGAFKDLVRSKGGGAVVALTGPPGTGKTLTAQVYSESDERPLYSIQCAQLGLTPEDLETSLQVVFRRARRWNAIVLLDEADVYVRQRADDLVQNAIVGVFLRVLEGQDNVTFLTTNRAGDIDDAVLSRCIALIQYKKPDTDERRRLWEVLAASGAVSLAATGAEALAGHFTATSGRDIKNLLKLGAMLASRRGRGAVPEMADFEAAYAFRPSV